MKKIKNKKRFRADLEESFLKFTEMVLKTFKHGTFGEFFIFFLMLEMES